MIAWATGNGIHWSLSRAPDLEKWSLALGAQHATLSRHESDTDINYAKDFKSPNDLEAGDCITATGLSDDSADSVTEIKTTACSNRHDGEVLATHELTADAAASSGANAPDVCTPAITEAGKAALVTEDITVTALTVANPDAGDSAACVAYKTDGSQLTGKLG